MALPPVEELSRWTVSHVNNWLTTSSLTAFRDGFLRDKIDGSKLMRLEPHEIDQRYNTVPAKKRNVLKDHLSKFESTRSPPSWSATPPQLPPRPGPSRAPAPFPSRQELDDDNGSDDGWGSEDFDDDIDEYLEPTVTPAHLMAPSTPGRRVNGHQQQLPPEPEEPQSEYEIPLEEPDAGQMSSGGLVRKATLVDRLKNELEIRKRESQARMEHEDSSASDSDEEAYIEPITMPIRAVQETPPPRPPRGKPVPEGPSYRNTHQEPVSKAPAAAAPPPLPSGRRPPPQPVPAQEPSPPNDVYEIMSDTPTAEPPEEQYMIPDTTEAKPNNYLDFSETSKKGQTMGQNRNSSAGGPGDVPLPPRPVKKLSSDSLPSSQQQGGWLFNNEQAASAPSKAAPAGDDLSAYEWYHGKISRDHAQMIFQRERTDGMFLIRKSERDPKQPYTLVIWHCNRIWNLPIRKLENNKFAAGKRKDGETHFNTIVDLVEHFKVVSLSLKSDDQVQGNHNLTIPAPRQ